MAATAGQSSSPTLSSTAAGCFANERGGSFACAPAPSSFIAADTGTRSSGTGYPASCLPRLPASGTDDLFAVEEVNLAGWDFLLINILPALAAVLGYPEGFPDIPKK